MVDCNCLTGTDKSHSHVEKSLKWAEKYKPKRTILCHLDYTIDFDTVSKDLPEGVELAYECMVEVGIKPESAYYESLHETPLIANTIARKKLYEMNRIISDTAENSTIQYSFKEIALGISKGSTMSEMLDKYPEVFNIIFCFSSL